MFSFLRRPSVHQVQVDNLADPFEAARGKTLLETMLGLGLSMPHDCKVGSCGTCRFRLIDGKISELSASALVLGRDELAAGYRLACQAMPRSDLRIAVDSPLVQGQPAQDFRATITRMRRLCDDIIGLTLELDRPMSFRPGQYADLSLDAVDGARSYSFAFAPMQEAVRTVHFHVRHVPGGAFTGWLFGADRIGEELKLTGPMGNFQLREGDSPILCVAGGSGLAPILSILQGALAAGTVRPVTLLYGARSQAHLYCLDEIETIRRAWPAPFTFVPALSDEAPDSSWNGARGLITDHLAGMTNLAAHEAYLCGPPLMIDAAEARLIAAGMPSTAIAADRFYDRGTPARSELGLS